MPTITDLDIRLTSLEGQFVSFLAGTKTPSELTGPERKQLENSLYPVINGFRARKGAANNDYTSWQIGDQIIEIDSSNKLQVVGEVILVPFDPTTDLQDRSKFDLYKQDSPAI